MKLRKANAVFSLISTVLIFVHAISLAAWMLSQGHFRNVPWRMSWVLTAAVAIHAIISFVLMIIAKKDHKGPKGKQYPKLNRPTIIQRISGVLMIVFSALHILGASGITHTPPLVHAIVPPVFFTVVLAHVAISTSKAFITLGIGNAGFVKAADIIIKIICLLTLIADISGFYLFVC